MNKYLLTCVLLAQITVNALAQCNCSGSFSSISFGETGSASLTLSKNQWQLETYREQKNFDPIPMHHHTSEMIMLQKTTILTAGVSYGITDRITLSIKQPNVWLYATPESTNRLGDLQFISTINFMDINGYIGAFIAGVEFPTGKKSAFSNEANLTIGSGSFDPLGGIMMVKSFPKSLIRSSAFYKQGTSGFNSINFGSIFSYNLSFNYKLKEAKGTCTTDSLKTGNDFFWNIFTGTLGEWSSEQTKDKSILENTGGHSLFLQAGTLVGFGKWSIPVSFSIPLTQELKGEQSQNYLRTKVGIIKTF